MVVGFCCFRGHNFHSRVTDFMARFPLIFLIVFFLIKEDFFPVGLFIYLLLLFFFSNLSTLLVSCTTGNTTTIIYQLKLTNLLYVTLTTNL